MLLNINMPTEAQLASQAEQPTPQSEVVERRRTETGDASKVERFVSAQDALRALTSQHDQAERAIEQSPLSLVPESAPITQRSEQKLEELTQESERQIEEAAGPGETPAITTAEATAQEVQEAKLLDEADSNPVTEEKVVAAMNQIVTERRLQSGAQVDAESVMKALGRTVLSQDEKNLIAKIRIGGLVTMAKPKAEAPVVAAAAEAATAKSVESPVEQQPVAEPMVPTARVSMRQAFSLDSMAQTAPTAEAATPSAIKTLRQEFAAASTERPAVGISPMAESVRQPEAAPAQPTETALEAAATIPEAVQTMRSPGTPEAAPASAEPITLAATPEAISVATESAPTVVEAEAPTVVEAAGAEAPTVSEAETPTVVPGVVAAETAVTKREAETPTLTAPAEAKALSLQEKRAARIAKMDEGRGIVRGLMDIAGYSTEESIEQRQERMNKLTAMLGKLTEFVRANPSMAGEFGLEISKLSGALEDNKGVQERAVAKKRQAEAAAQKLRDAVVPAAATGAAIETAVAPMAEAPIELAVTPEQLAAEKNKNTLEGKFNKLDGLEPDVWSDEYTGFGVEWNRSQWEALSSAKQPGSFASEKEMFKQLRLNSLGNQFKLDQLGTDLKNVREQIAKLEAAPAGGMGLMTMQEQMAMARGGESPELQQLIQKEKDVLLEIRKVEELKTQNETAEKALQSLAVERIARQAAEKAAAEKQIVIMEGEAQAAAAQEQQAQMQQPESAKAAEVTVASGKPGTLMKGALIGGGIVGTGLVFAFRGLRGLARGTGWVLSHFMKAKTLGDGVSSLFDGVIKKLDGWLLSNKEKTG